MSNPDPKVLSVSFRARELCTRCGTCVGVCPVDALSLDASRFPVLDMEDCIECGRCGRCCPGGRVSYEALTKLCFGDACEDVDDFDGQVLESCLAHATDDAMRKSGASGGAVTAILSALLQSGTVAGCVVTRMSSERPWEGDAFIATSLDELMTAQQSLYLCIPVNAILNALRDREGRFAVVALPCQIQGLRLAMKEDSQLATRVACIIGLFCATTIEPYFPEELLQMRGLQKEQVAGFRFREGEWPGRICAMMPDGSPRPLHPSNFKDGAINYMAYLYSPPRCQVCLDGSSEFADIAAADAWARDAAGGYQNRGETRLLIRTDAGAAALATAIERDALATVEGSGVGSRVTPRHHQRKKAVTHRLRVARWKKRKKPVPDYDRGAPKAGIKAKLIERAESALMGIGRRPVLRRGLFRFLTSPAGKPLIWMRQLRKRWGYR